MTRTTIPIPHGARYGVANYCIDNIGPRKYHLHNAIGGESWAIKYDPRINHSNTGNWVVECASEHAVIIRLKYGA